MSGRAGPAVRAGQLLALYLLDLIVAHTVGCMTVGAVPVGLGCSPSGGDGGYVKKYPLRVLLALLAAIAAITLLHSGRSYAVADVAASVSDQGASSSSWVTVRDPREQAFSIAVPKGWKTHGGLFRFSAVDARLVVDMTSPDGDTNVRVGDSTVPPYLVPGRFVRPGPRLAAYASGSVFATKYGQARFGSMCERLQLTRSQAIAPKYHPPGSGLIR